MGNPVGRPRQPDELKLARGTWREDRDGDVGGVVVPDGVPECPASLQGEGRQLWDAIVPKLETIKVATGMDSTQLVVMCEWWARYRSISKVLDECDVEEKRHYSLMIQAGLAWKNFDSIASRFGLTPVDRARLRVEGDDVGKPVVASRKRG